MPEDGTGGRPVDLVIAEARAQFGERLTTNASLREQHSHGEDTNPPALPDAVAFAETTEEAASLLALCNRHRVPVVPFGAGTSLEGHVTPVRGGISLDLSHMRRVIEVHQEDMDCRVEAGVTREQLNTHLRDQGLFFPVDPGSECTIGGMCATRASGTNAVRYGTIRENVLGLTVALADGQIIQTGGRVRKSSTGYDLTRLFIGSEGTLGVITEVALRLHGIPEAIAAATCQFATLAGAVSSVIAVMQAGIPVARIELLDDVQMEASIAFSKLSGLAALPTLFFEFHGSPAAVAEQARQAEEIALSFGAERFAAAEDNSARAHLWKARHDAYWAALALKPGWRGLPRTRSCRSRGWPRRCSAPRRTSPPPASSRRSSAMWATAISTPSSWCRPSRAGSSAPGRSSARSSPARWRSAARRAASTASASASASSSCASTAKARSLSCARSRRRSIRASSSIPAKSS